MDMGTQIARDRMKAQRYPIPWTPLTHCAEKFGILELFQMLMADIFGILELIQLLIGENFGILVTLSGINCGQVLWGLII